MKYSFAELQLAEELCFPADMQRLLAKHEPEFALILFGDFKHRHQRSLLKMIFDHSRADYLVRLSADGLTMGDLFEAIVNDLLHKA